MPRSLAAFLVSLISASAFADPFPISSPESQGVHSAGLRKMAEWIRAEDHDVRSLIVLRNGHLVLEWYGRGVSRDQNHNLYSVTKSVVALLAGIAIQEGLIKDTDQTLGELFPGSVGLKEDPAKAAITLEDLLTMRSGLPQARANQPGSPMKEIFDRVHQSPDRLALILDEFPLSGRPGASFAYGNIEPQLVLAAIEERSGEEALRFANRHLFEPLEFENAKWSFPDQEGRLPGGYGLRLRAIDLAKIGQLCLQQGRWKGKPLVDPEWIEASTRDWTGSNYGYYWWLGPRPGSYSAKGVRGQRLEIFPDLGLVFVVTADLPPAQVSTITRTLTQDHLLQAVTPNVPLPEDARGQ